MIRRWMKSLLLWLRSGKLGSHRKFLNGSITEYVVVGALFAVLTLFFTNFVLLQGTHQLFIEGPGDGTAGLVWINTVDNDWNPEFTHTTKENYPIGEETGSPTHITSITLIGSMWVLTKCFGAIMALNILTFFGFWSCAMAMYWLMKRLTGSVPVAFFSGIAAAFVPYHIMKSSTHLTYIYSVNFILIIAAFIGLWNKQTWRRSLLLGGAIALAFYTDGYFLLLASVLVACLVLGSAFVVLLQRLAWKKILAKIKYFSLAVGFLLLFMLPILFVQFTQGKQVQGQLANARGNIAFEADFYAAQPLYYLLPSPHNPFFINDPAFQELTAYKNTKSNSSENTLYIGYTLVALCIIGATLLLTHLLKLKNSTLTKLSKPQKDRAVFILVVSLITIPILIFWSMPPHLQIMGTTIVTPSGVLIHFGVALWRVMARFFLPMHAMVVIMAGYSLALLLKTTARKKWTPYVVCAVLATLLCTEYASLTSRPSYDFNNLPQAYHWIKDQPDIKVIAELPIVDRPLDMSYNYTTAQVLHLKSLVNTHSTNNLAGFTNAIGGDSYSEEAVDFAYQRGADTIITHNEPCRDVSWGKLEYVDTNNNKTKESVYYGSPICVYKITRPISEDKFFIRLKQGSFGDDVYVSSKNHKVYNLIFGNRGTLYVADALGNKVTGRADFEAAISQAPNAKSFKGTWSVYQDGVLLAQGSVPGKVTATIDASKSFDVAIKGTNGEDPTLFQIALSDTKVTAQSTK